ncbi:MAG: DNA-binding protein [Nitrososphaerota archaeon]|nr:DNA-binding protein [Nitrososphaerota archaeon]MDG6966182.1 DNA-binding protein [Nitrososphaerota archaeon]MDG6977617.1 DNA-binding protein [Nitrososphaerota archaeon]MDG7020358.1 DNA-binding protein [Nitrososphaerota archaeon]MDG7022564.1 DNA-binding protein [Nitrososphaerota archaeon]
MDEQQHKEAQPRGASQDEQARRAMRENVMRVALTSEARQRLANVKMVKPDVAHAIEEYIVQLVSSGRLKRTIDDDQLKELLSSIQGTAKREFKIRRI